jgi:hypothetical protein
MIERAIKDQIVNNLKASNKLIIIYGARQVGKTTLANSIVKELNLKTLSVNLDQDRYAEVFSSRDFAQIKSLVGGYECVFIDEAQRAENIGLNLKIITDEMKEIKVIATGSSSFELANKIAEPLTGRVWTYSLYSLAFCELKKYFNSFELEGKIEELIIYGSYPEVFTTSNYQEKKNLLSEIARSYLYKDALELVNVKHAKKIKDLLKLVAFQIGSEVSINELARALGLGHDTVERYLDLLEKAFVIFRLSGFSRNLRKEVTKMDKIYFYDLGIRNAIIDNFKPLKDRIDPGQLWENFLVMERKKFIDYNKLGGSSYFWRTQTGAELDYVEDRDGKLYGYEFKFNDKIVKAPKSWLDNYPGSEFKTINRSNYLDFIT